MVLGSSICPIADGIMTNREMDVKRKCKRPFPEIPALSGGIAFLAYRLFKALTIAAQVLFQRETNPVRKNAGRETDHTG